MINDDDLLRSVAKAARVEREARDPALERLTRGEATEDDQRALEARAAGDADAARALALHRPLEGAAHDRIAAAILVAKVAPLLERAAPTAEDAATVSRSPRSNVRRLFAIVAPLAAAAVLLLVLAFRPGDRLPSYELAVRPASDVRLSPAPPSVEPVRLHPSSTLELVLRPREPLKGQVALRAVLVRDGRATSWTPSTERAEGGALRVRARVDAILPEASGAWGIVVAVARPDSLPSAAELAHQATRGEQSEPPRGVQILRTKIEIVPDP